MTMIRFTKLFLGFTLVWLAIWLIPSVYDFFFARLQNVPFTLYSTVIDDFAWIERTGDRSIRIDRAGNRYSEQEYDSILPMFYYRQLIADEKFPTELKGVELTPRMAQTENFSFKSTPSAVNVSPIGLYPLLESLSGRVDLEMPGDVFRMTGTGIEFVDMETNTVETEKSRIFTNALLKKGFRFPARIIAGNPTVRKEYDEGYMLLDDGGALFHFKQVKGRPYCRAIELPEGMDIAHIFPTEFRNRRYHAFLTDRDNRMYALSTHTYEIKPIGIPSFDPTREAITIIGNPFDWTLTRSTLQGVTVYAIDAQTLQCIDSMRHPDVPSWAEKLRPYVMPLRLTFTSQFDRDVLPRLNAE